MPTAFAKAFINKAKKTFSQAKNYKHRTSKSFGNADVPDGNFTAVVTAEASVIEKGKMEGTPLVRFTACINQGPYEGQEPSKVFFCEGKPIPTSPDEFPTAEQQLVGLLGFLLPDVEIDDVEQVEQAIDEINRRGPVCIVGIRNREVNGKKYQDVFFNKVVVEDSFASNDTSPAEESKDGVDSAETTDTDPPFDYEPTKGDMVILDGDEGEWEVAQVSQSRKTVNLVNPEGVRKSGIAWADVSLL